MYFCRLIWVMTHCSGSSALAGCPVYATYLTYLPLSVFQITWDSLVSRQVWLVNCIKFDAIEQNDTLVLILNLATADWLLKEGRDDAALTLAVHYADVNAQPISMHVYCMISLHLTCDHCSRDTQHASEWYSEWNILQYYVIAECCDRKNHQSMKK